MDWNVFMPFIGFGGAVVICGLIFKIGAYYKSNEYEIKFLSERINRMENQIKDEKEKNKILEVEITKLKTLVELYKKQKVVD